MPNLGSSNVASIGEKFHQVGNYYRHCVLGSVALARCKIVVLILKLFAQAYGTRRQIPKTKDRSNN
jgi:hypothetical protein